MTSHCASATGNWGKEQITNWYNDYCRKQRRPATGVYDTVEGHRDNSAYDVIQMDKQTEHHTPQRTRDHETDAVV